jgi:hypothetical protein
MTITQPDGAIWTERRPLGWVVFGQIWGDAVELAGSFKTKALAEVRKKALIQWARQRERPDA